VSVALKAIVAGVMTSGYSRWHLAISKYCVIS